MEFTHLDEKGQARMVDVSHKDKTTREAVAFGVIKVNKDIMEALLNQSIPKGDVLGCGRVAGIMAVKKTWEAIPMCHPLNITKCSIDFEIKEKDLEICCTCTAKITGQTGVEMEALHGVSIALLTIYDMCKALGKDMEIKNIHLLEKSGGKSGKYIKGE